MHHFRGRLLDGATPCLEPANAYIEYLGPQDGSKPNWNGYLLIGEGTDLRPGATYTLSLEDGRSGDLAIDHIEPDDSAPGRLRALFRGESPLA
ncbi:hypothetical protein [Tautonia sociabilis]|uniref:Uncharacterized protein n=1 Tax=Tautonia sociabilis TaxID=2080755 RepID=A0A432MMV8_9BACT|nr:hypothetical protein [Tautonia sociabilis]RUL88527.1 hypothetical protein TsocGM_06285 [Tautonia sociabilis]